MGGRQHYAKGQCIVSNNAFACTGKWSLFRSYHCCHCITCAGCSNESCRITYKNHNSDFDSFCTVRCGYSGCKLCLINNRVVKEIDPVVSKAPFLQIELQYPRG